MSAPVEATAAVPDRAPAVRPRRRRRLFYALLALCLAVRASLGLWLPSLVANMAKERGWACAYESLDLTLCMADVELTHLRLEPLQGEGPSVHIEYARVDVSVWNLLFGEIVIPRIEVDGLDLSLTRGADGRLVLPGNLLAADHADAALDASDADLSAPAPDAASTAALPSLAAPLRLDALRLQHVQIDWRDESLDPPLVTRLYADLRVSDLGSPTHPTRVSVSMAARDLFDRLHVEFTGSSSEHQLTATLQLRLGGLDLTHCAELLAPLGLSQVGNSLHCDLVGDIELGTDPARPALDLSLRQLSLGAGGGSDVELTRLALILKDWGDDLRLEDVALEGLSARAERRADGSFHLAGLRWTPMATDESTVDEPSTPVGGGLVIDRLRLAEHRFEWRDEAVFPAAEVVLLLDELTLTDLSLGTASSSSAELEGELSAPGVFESLSLNGSVQSTPSGGRMQLDLALDGLAPDALAGYLAAASMRHHMQDGRVALTLEGEWSQSADESLHVDGRLKTLLFMAAGERLSLGELTLQGFVQSADGSSTVVDAVDLVGLAGRLAWDVDGVLLLPGLEIGVADPSVAADGQAAQDVGASVARDAATIDSAAPPASSLADTADASRFTLHRLSVDAQQLTLVPPSGRTLPFSDLGIEVVELVMADGPLTLGRFDLHLALPGVIEWLQLGGEAGREGQTSVVALELSAQGLDASLAEVWMSPDGARPSFRDAELSFAATMRSEPVASGSDLSFTLTDLTLADEGRQVLGLDRLQVDHLLQAGADVELGLVLIDGLVVEVAREADGSLALPGLLLPATPSIDEASDDLADGAEVNEPVGPAPSAAEPTGPATRIHADRVVLTGGSVHFQDRALLEPVNTRLALDIELNGLELGDDPAPTDIELTLAVPGSIEQLVLSGQVVLSARTARADLSLSSRGLTLTGLAAYLGPATRPVLEDGRLDLRLVASVLPHADGGLILSAEIADCRLRDGEQGPTLLGWESLGLTAPRFDTSARVFEIEDLHWLGLAGSARRDDDGALHVLGLVLAAPAPPVADDGVETPLDAVTGNDSLASGDESGEADDTAALEALAPARGLPISLRLDQLALSADRFSWYDAAKPALTLDGLTLRNRGAIELGAELRSAPFDLQLATALPPLLSALELSATVDPFAIEPEARLELSLQGLNGQALSEFAPDLIEGEGLVDGHLSARVDLAWLGARIGPLDFDVGNGVPIDLVVSDLAFRDGPDGELLLGLSQLRAEIDRALGSSGAVLVRSLEIVAPVARIERNEQGWRVMNLLFLAPPEPLADEQAEDIAANEATIELVFEPGPERAVENLLLSGADVIYRDVRTDPPFVLPLKGLELDIRGASTRVLTEDLPVSASVFLRGGAPEIEPGTKRVPRPIFEEISIDGRWTFYPRFAGRTQVQLQAVDLPAFRGPAAAGDVIIEDGVLDARIDLEFQPDGDLQTDSRFLFSDLDVDEPADGPISRYLKLPSALGGVLFVLRDEDGVIDVRLSFDVDAGGVSTAEVTQAAVTTLGVLIASAIANTPFRVVGGLTDAVGALIGIEDEVLDPGEPVTLPFGAAEISIAAVQDAALAELCARLQDEDQLIITLHHEIGANDQLLLSERANPPADWVTAMAERLRLHKQGLARERAQLAERLFAELTAGLVQAARGSTRALGALDERIGLAEQGLDELLEMLRPGSERLAGRRTRTMCLSIAQLRLDRVAARLRQELAPTEHDRVRVLAPRWEPQPARGNAVIVITPAIRLAD